MTIQKNYSNNWINSFPNRFNKWNQLICKIHWKNETFNLGSIRRDNSFSSLSLSLSLSSFHFFLFLSTWEEYHRLKKHKKNGCIGDILRQDSIYKEFLLINDQSNLFIVKDLIYKFLFKMIFMNRKSLKNPDRIMIMMMMMIDPRLNIFSVRKSIYFRLIEKRSLKLKYKALWFNFIRIWKKSIKYCRKQSNSKLNDWLLRDQFDLFMMNISLWCDARVAHPLIDKPLSSFSRWLIDISCKRSLRIRWIMTDKVIHFWYMHHTHHFTQSSYDLLKRYRERIYTIEFHR